MLEQQRTANSRASKCFTSAQAPLLAQAWADAIALLETGLQEMETAGPQADAALLSSLSAALAQASTALRERDTARLNAERLSCDAQQAANECRFEDMLQAYEKAIGTCQLHSCSLEFVCFVTLLKSLTKQNQRLFAAQGWTSKMKTG